MIKKLFLLTLVSVTSQLLAIAPAFVGYQPNGEPSRQQKEASVSEEVDAHDKERAEKIKKALELINKKRQAGGLPTGSVGAQNQIGLATVAASAGLILAKKAVDALASSNFTKPMSDKNVKETNDEIDEAVSFLERIKAMLSKMNDIVSQADALCTKVTALIEKLLLIKYLCI